MRTYPNCIPSTLGATLGGARLGGAPKEVAWAIATAGARISAGWDRSLPPILLGAQIGRVLRNGLQQADSYWEAKRAANAAALACCPRWNREVARAPDPLFHALRLAAAGNCPDLGVRAAVDPHPGVDRARPESARSDYEAFRAVPSRARHVLLLADNAGEIVLDGILVEELVARGKRVTVAVRGGPALNDVTSDDALQVGLNSIAEILPTGSDVPRVFLAEASAAFREQLRDARLILSKGMGEFEGLSEEPAPLSYLLQAKCGPVAREIGVERGSLVLLGGRG